MKQGKNLSKADKKAINSKEGQSSNDELMALKTPSLIQNQLEGQWFLIKVIYGKARPINH